MLQRRLTKLPTGVQVGGGRRGGGEAGSEAWGEASLGVGTDRFLARSQVTCSCCCCFSSRAALPAGRRSGTVDLRPPVSQWLLMAPEAADQGRDDAVVLQLRR